MTPSTWPALIVGAFTILNPSTNVGPTTADTDVAPVTIMATQPAFPPTSAPSDRSYTLGLGGILSPSVVDGQPVTITAPTTVTVMRVDGGQTHSYVLKPPAPGTSVVRDKSADAHDQMPNIWIGGDPNKIDPMCSWNGTDPNEMDHMAYGYDPSAVKFFGAPQASTIMPNWMGMSIIPPLPPPATKPAPTPSK